MGGDLRARRRVRVGRRGRIRRDARPPGVAPAARQSAPGYPVIRRISSYNGRSRPYMRR
jgi:hypothetical protein